MTDKTLHQKKSKIQTDESGCLEQCDSKMTFDWGYYEVKCQLEKGHEGKHRHEWEGEVND